MTYLDVATKFDEQSGCSHYIDNKCGCSHLIENQAGYIH